ncbi:hypothetical protein EVAR_7619_1 [Eumeta japonica]|uniref:Uncharacterized protein n=1 Tax=Eumeta variegata TaxID=151549 RepID=A0A4C1TJ12_EUMVA|nr:hypothetical protein EVAR_7619_1 [Eumeta japonica]
MFKGESSSTWIQIQHQEQDWDRDRDYNKLSDVCASVQCQTGCRARAYAHTCPAGSDPPKFTHTNPHVRLYVEDVAVFAVNVRGNIRRASSHLHISVVESAAERGPCSKAPQLGLVPAVDKHEDEASETRGGQQPSPATATILDVICIENPM